MKKGFKRLLSIALCSLMLATIMPSAMAELISSTEKTTVVGVYAYTHYSSVSNNAKGEMAAQTNIREANKEEVPVGYMGARARLYTSSGTLKASTDWKFNDYETKSFASYNSFSVPSGYYYSKGEVKFYNGNGYTSVSCNSSPNLSVQNIASVQKNENGEVYGSEYLLNQIGIEPDLIEAIGDNGEIGYVKRVDVEGDGALVSSPEAALIYTMTCEGERQIPLYSEDGETVTGTFTIKNLE